MELQINQFWILKVHSMINSTNEYEPGPLNTFCTTRVKKLKILLRMYELISHFGHPEILQFLKDNFPLHIIRKELRISPQIKFH